MIKMQLIHPMTDQHQQIQMSNKNTIFSFNILIRNEQFSNDTYG